MNRIRPKHLKANILYTAARARDNKWARHLTDIKGWEERSQVEIQEKIRAPKSSKKLQHIPRNLEGHTYAAGHVLRKDKGRP